MTPDSFSDGGQWESHSDAIAHGLELAAGGADIVDIGGESTRPGAPSIAVEDELRRVIPVLRALVADDVVVSVDTMHSEVAEAAVAAGASLVNDVSGGLADPRMLEVMATLGVPYVVMHWRGHSANMDELATYDDVVAEVSAELKARVDAACEAGIDLDAIVLDPGLGFAKQVRHNWPLLAGLDALNPLGLPVVVGASRKRFLGALLADSSGGPRPVDERDDATHAVSAIAASEGVWGVRVHDVRGSADAVRVGAAWRAARSGAER